MKNLPYRGNTAIGRALYDLQCMPMVVNPSSLGDESGTLNEVDEDKLIELITDRWFNDLKRQVILNIIRTIIQEEQIENLTWYGVRLIDEVDRPRENWRTLSHFFYDMWPNCMSRSEAAAMENRHLDKVPSLEDENVTHILECIGSQSRTMQGRFSKRLSAYMKKVHGIKMSEADISLIGNIYNDCRTVDKNFLIRVTNDFSWEDGCFGNENSCWWGCYSESRDTLHHYGGYGILFYPTDCTDIEDDSNGYGRVWIYPVSDHLAITFNSYGNEGKVAAAVAAKLLEKLMGDRYVYGKRFVVNDGCSEFNYPYINGDNLHNNDNGAKCFAIFSGDRPGDTIRIEMDKQDGYFSMRKCCNCDEGTEDGREADNGDYYCDECYNDRFTHCERCNDEIDSNDIYHFEDSSDDFCQSCFEQETNYSCDNCGNNYRYGHGIEAQSGEVFCQSCADRRFDHCTEHDVYTFLEECKQCVREQENA